jgi:predicted PurR-regulated permease PerM
MDVFYKIPFYAKAALIFICIFFFVYSIYIAQEIILPLVFAGLISILLNPAVNYLICKNIGKIISISIVVVLATLVVIGAIYLISSQLAVLRDTLPGLRTKFNTMNVQFVNWVSENLNIPETRINSWISESENKLMNNFTIEENLAMLWRLLLDGMLLPIYAFLILYYKTLLLDFVLKIFRAQHHAAVTEVLISTKKIIQGYLAGIFIELIIVAVLNSGSLLLLGIDYAIILGILGAVLNIIPYVGGMVGMIFPMIIACVTKDSIFYTIYIFLIYTVILFIDNHYLRPYVVASRVKINALIALVVIFIGDAVWGIPGMFLSIPLTAMVKVICDHIEPLKPWGFLLGNTVPRASRFSLIRKKQKPTLYRNAG